MDKKHRIFFAIPFDTATRDLYNRVSAKIRIHYPNLTSIIGTQEVGPSPKYNNIVSFKSQNRELMEQFVSQIQEADIVIADLSHNNPNVHVELGIALMEKKNILRVTGRSVSELGFDIRNLYVYQYKNEEQLVRKIQDYLKTFFSIKRLPFSKKYDPLYYEESKMVELFPLRNGAEVVFYKIPYKIKIRDGAVKVDFEFVNVKDNSDWFGVYFRAGNYPTIDSHLVYVRKNGSVDLATYHPGLEVVNSFPYNKEIINRKILTLQYENDSVEIRIGKSLFKSEKLINQKEGDTYLAAYRVDVRVHSVKMICRDTIEWG